MSEERSERGFVVIDKRGNGGEKAAADEEPKAPAAPEEASDAPRAYPKPDFAALVVSLGSSALFHLGLVPDPATGETGAPDLPLARQTIDLVEILQEKTHGNLTPEEDQLLQSLLTDLRMRYVEASK
ncbi:MAG: DUF1844 domain-containing protein [Myxococcales bacterium]|nr:DUF1844 domain-containing protein [Myxococcales bacterium]